MAGMPDRTQSGLNEDGPVQEPVVANPTPRELAELAVGADGNDDKSRHDLRPRDFEPDDSGPQLPATLEPKKEGPPPPPPSPKADDDGDDDDGGEHDTSMTVFEHLDELRTRLFRSIAYIAIAFFASLFFCKSIMRFLQAPAGDIEFQALSIEEPIVVFFKVAFYTALVIASPMILFEVSRFVAPGLTRKEKQIVTPALIGGPVLFVAGAAFAYYLLLPPMLHFFSSFGQGVTPINQRLDYYMSLVSTIMLYMGLCFQLPIVLFALSWTGLVNSTMLMRVWRYAVFATSVVAMIITPDPTAFSMILVMGALMGLYAITVVLLRLFGR